MNATERDVEWKKVEEALKKDQPKTVIGMLPALQAAAVADSAWGEAGKALALRVLLEGRIEGGLAEAVTRLDAEVEKVPEAMRPILQALSAEWLYNHYEENRWEFMQRTQADGEGEEIDSWSLARILSEIDQRLQAALKNERLLQGLPVADFEELLTKGSLGDEMRPTLFDFIAHEALTFYALEENAASRPADAFRIEVDSPAFDGMDEFLAWRLEAADSPAARAVGVFQSLLRFHRDDASPAARLHCELERLLWAEEVAVGEGKDARIEAALRRFIAAHGEEVESARARHHLAGRAREDGETLEAHRLAKAGAERFPEHAYGKLCRNLVDELEQEELQIGSESQWSPTGEPLHVTHRNLDRVWFRLYTLPFEARAGLQADPVPSGKELRELLEGRPDLAWEEVLPDDKDYAVRQTKLSSPANAAAGYHVLVASAREDFSELVVATGVHISKLAMNVRPSLDGGIEGVVVDAVTGAPQNGVEVRVWQDLEAGRLERVDGQSGEDGFFRFAGVSRSCLVVAQQGSERAVVRTWGSGEARRTVEPFERAVLFTDRAIYRPGQTLHVKGIWCRVDQAGGKYETRRRQKGELVLSDPNGEEVRKQTFETNERGGFAATFTLPEGRALGAYSLQVPQVPGGSMIRVEEYKRPKFFTEIGSPVGDAALGKRVTVEGRAEAYTGAAVDGAKVSWRVTRRVRWPSWIGCCGWYLPPASSAEEIAHGESVTGADGSFRMAFEARPDRGVPEDVEPVFEFEVTADVTDGAGETRSASRRVSVAYTTVRASLSAGDWWVAGEPVELSLRTESHDGAPRPTSGVLKLHRLVEPETCPRTEAAMPGGRGGPDAAAPAADPDRWELGELVESIEVSTGAETGAAKVKRALEAGAYRWVFEGKDANGRAVKAFLGIQVVDPAAKDFPTMVPFFTQAPQWSVEPGEEVALLWGSGHEQARAYVEWYGDQKLLKREWSRPGRTQQVFRLPIEEAHRGGVTVQVHQVTQNRLHRFVRQVAVPWTNKDLKVRWEHIVSKLEPGVRQTWTAVIEGGDAAEMVATLYDASLDAFAEHGFGGLSSLFRQERGMWLRWQFSSEFRGWPSGFGSPSVARFSLSDPYRRLELGGGFDGEEIIDGFGGRRVQAFGGIRAAMVMESSSAYGMGSKHAELRRDAADAMRSDGGSGAGKVAEAPVPVRTNLQETAFFAPMLTADEDGTVRMSFTMPEALTTWKFLGFAHDEAMRGGLLTGETVTAKDLMVQPNPPRFLREGDELEFTVKITNLSDEAQSGTAQLDLAAAATGTSRNEALGLTEVVRAFEVPAGESRTASWRIRVPDGEGFLRYRATARSGDLTDGEEGWLPVLSRRVMVTESMSLPIRDAGEREFTFDKLRGSADSVENRFVHLQVVSQPAWYAVMALPYLMEFPHDCAEQTFSRYYANALAGHIADSDPKVRRIFDLWKQSDALASPLLKNEELKGILIEETPWLAEAEDESEARRRVGLLFDDDRLSRELDEALRKLEEMQGADGLWPWFPGGRGNAYITRYIVSGFARLRALGIETDITPALEALPRLDAELTRLHRQIVDQGDPETCHLDPAIAQHLSMRTHFLKDRKIDAKDRAAFDYFVGQARRYWTELGSRMSRGHVALALHRLGEAEVPGLIARSLKEHAQVTEEQGMFWRDAEGEGWWWWQAPIETQAMMIEVFREVTADRQAVEDCQVWLIKQKQVADWRTTKATADAVHALLMGGENLLGSDALLEVSLGGAPVDPGTVEPGTGMYEKRYVGPEVKPGLGEVVLEKSDAGVAWASLHWQYLEDLGKVTAAGGDSLQLEKQLFVKRNRDEGQVLERLEGPLEVGDELVTRLILRNDRAMEFVHLKDQRGSGTEPVNVLSGYRWQDGFGYYEMTRDTASHFFIDRLPPGTHVFETSVRVQHRGRYESGLAEIRCMYAPEFAAHSESVEVVVK